jgi:hypothetical protein
MVIVHSPFSVENSPRPKSMLDAARIYHHHGYLGPAYAACLRNPFSLQTTTCNTTHSFGDSAARRRIMHDTAPRHTTRHATCANRSRDRTDATIFAVFKFLPRRKQVPC